MDESTRAMEIVRELKARYGVPDELIRELVRLSQRIPEMDDMDRLAYHIRQAAGIRA